MSEICAHLRSAYETTAYVVSPGADEFTLTVGRHSHELDCLLDDNGAATAAFITAHNPRSTLLTDEENRLANQRLLAEITNRGHTWLPGEGRGHDGTWPAEASLLILGICREDAVQLGREFGQNAIVFVERGKGAKLLLLR